MPKHFYILTTLLFMIHSNEIIFDFNKDSDSSDWRIVDDSVMGGVSQGNFFVNKNGHGVFTGQVSLENNGGFSSLRYRFKEIDVNNYTKIILRVKGDGKNYQFRIKNDSNDYYSYVINFSTNKDWQEVELNFKDMYPTFRGRKLNMSNFSDNSIEEIAFLIGNKKNEKFEIEIDKIYLQ